MTKRLVTAVLIATFCTFAAWAELSGSVVIGDDGLFTYYKYDGDTYLLKLDPEDGSIARYWDARDLRSYDLFGVVEDDLLLRGSYERIYRFELPDADGDEPQQLWRIGLDGVGRLTTGNRAYAAQSDETVDAYSFDDGEKLEEFAFDAEDFLGFADEGFYAARDDGDELVYFDLTGAEQWVADIERISFDAVYPISGCILLADEDNRELFCIDDEGNKLWRHQYPWSYLPIVPTWGYSANWHTVERVGDYVVFADEDMSVFVSLENGDVAANTAPGIAEVPHAFYGSTFAKITVIDSYNRYGGPGDAVELFDIDELRMEALLMTPAPVVDDPRPVPTVSDAGVMYLPLEGDRLIGIDLDSGETVLDVTVELFDDEEGESW